MNDNDEIRSDSTEGQPKDGGDESRKMFSELAAFREEHNITLSEIAEHTHINLKYLQALEAGNLDEIPDVYDKLFFKTYLDYLNPEKKEEYLETFKKIRKVKKPKYTTTIRRVRSVKQDASKIKLMRTLMIIVPILIVIVILVILAVNTISVRNNDDELIDEISPQEIVQELDENKTTENDRPKKSSSSKTTTSGVNVVVAAVDTTWIQLVKDRGDTSEYMLNTGENLDLQADSVIQFVIGNAGGINFTVNGEPVGILGDKSQVISYLRITEQGIENQRIKEIR